MSSDRQLELILTRFNDLETQAEREEYIDKLENLIEQFNEAARQGEPVVPDSIYDTCMDYLRELKPDSYLLHQVWTADDSTVPLDEDLDQFLVSYPMLSIQTVKSMVDKPLLDFKSKLAVTEEELICSVKENGHAVRLVYNDGWLVKATSRGRSTNGRDLTKQMTTMLGNYNDSFEGLGVVELRGEVLLPFDNLEKAREFNPSIKSAFSGVASMIRESASEEETRLLHLVVYDVHYNGAEFETLAEKFVFLEEAGYTLPEYFVFKTSRRTFERDIENIIMEMDVRCSDYPYHTDGVVIAINNLDLFAEFGAEDSYRLGNLALKMGRWKQDNYIGTVGHIEWVNGKSKKTPVAILEEGVLTATGNTVTNVPLYAPCYILMLEAYPSRPIHFKYGGEAGVVPCFPDGRLVTDKNVRWE